MYTGNVEAGGELDEVYPRLVKVAMVLHVCRKRSVSVNG